MSRKRKRRRWLLLETLEGRRLLAGHHDGHTDGGFLDNTLSDSRVADDVRDGRRGFDSSSQQNGRNESKRNNDHRDHASRVGHNTSGGQSKSRKERVIGESESKDQHRHSNDRDSKRSFKHKKRVRDSASQRNQNTRSTELVSSQATAFDLDTSGDIGSVVPAFDPVRQSLFPVDPSFTQASDPIVVFVSSSNANLFGNLIAGRSGVATATSQQATERSGDTRVPAAENDRPPVAEDVAPTRQSDEAIDDADGTSAQSDSLFVSAVPKPGANRNAELSKTDDNGAVSTGDSDDPWSVNPESLRRLDQIVAQELDRDGADVDLTDGQSSLPNPTRPIQTRKSLQIEGGGRGDATSYADSRYFADFVTIDLESESDFPMGANQTQARRSSSLASSLKVDDVIHLIANRSSDSLTKLRDRVLAAIADEIGVEEEESENDARLFSTSHLVFAAATLVSTGCAYGIYLRSDEKLLWKNAAPSSSLMCSVDSSTTF